MNCKYDHYKFNFEGTTPTCGRTPGTPSGGSQDGFGGFQTDMLGNPIIPNDQTMSKPMLDMLGNQIESKPVESEQQTKINGVNIIGVVNAIEETEKIKATENVATESINLISTEDDNIESKFKEATI
jgi:hypothetical protein